MAQFVQNVCTLAQHRPAYFAIHTRGSDPTCYFKSLIDKDPGVLLPQNVGLDFALSGPCPNTWCLRLFHAHASFYPVPRVGSCAATERQFHASRLQIYVSTGRFLIAQHSDRGLYAGSISIDMPLLEPRAWNKLPKVPAVYCTQRPTILSVSLPIVDSCPLIPI